MVPFDVVVRYGRAETASTFFGTADRDVCCLFAVVEDSARRPLILAMPALARSSSFPWAKW